MIFFIIIALLLTLTLKRNPIYLIQNIEFKWPYLILIGFGTQIALEFIALNTSEKFEIILTITFLCILIGLWVNRNIIGVKWIFAGALMNVIALLVHGGLMPVSEIAIQQTGQEHLSFETDARHQPMNYSNSFWILGDWIPMIRYILSPGDVLVGIGIIRLIVKNAKQDIVK